VKLPFSCPNSSLSISVGETAPQLIGTKACLARLLMSWSVCATSSLPVPVSPSTKTAASVGADFATMS
jgi:hypothetical protein